MAKHSFQLPVVYNGAELTFQTILQSGYTFRFLVSIYEHELVFEQDDEGSYRVINYGPDSADAIEPTLLQAVIRSLEIISTR